MASADGQTNQLLLRLAYRDLLHRSAPLPELADVEFRCYSQNGEDGVLLYLFSLLGTTSRRVVEICAGEGTECNAANLIINHGWQGLLFDGDPDNVARGTAFFGTHPNTKISPASVRARVDNSGERELAGKPGRICRADRPAVPGR